MPLFHSPSLFVFLFLFSGVVCYHTDNFPFVIPNFIPKQLTVKLSNFILLQIWMLELLLWLAVQKFQLGCPFNSHPTRP